MITQDISFLIAFGAGFLSFLSPCIIPLIPAYIMYITGTYSEEELGKKRIFALSRTLGFVLGFTIVFVILGLSVSSIGQSNFFKANKGLITQISGILIILFGINMLGLLKLGFLNKEVKFKAPKKMTNWFGSTLMGMAFAAGWTPCFGPILGTIVLYAGTQDTLAKGVYLLIAYSIGLAVPFILTALFINAFSGLVKKSDKILKYTSKISGIILIIFGLAMFFGQIEKLTNILTKYLPVY